MVARKFTVFALFYFVFEGNFPSTSPRGVYIWRGDFTEGFLRCRFRGLIFGGGYTWRGLFSEFYGILLIYTSTGQNQYSVLLTEQKNITTKLKDEPGCHYKKDYATRLLLTANANCNT